ncbi:hypothetical protein AWENTII_003722 [Aspergillus wentii]
MSTKAWYIIFPRIRAKSVPEYTHSELIEEMLADLHYHRVTIDSCPSRTDLKSAYVLVVVPADVDVYEDIASYATDRLLENQQDGERRLWIMGISPSNVG